MREEKESMCLQQSHKHVVDIHTAHKADSGKAPLHRLLFGDSPLHWELPSPLNSSTDRGASSMVFTREKRKKKFECAF